MSPYSDQMVVKTGCLDELDPPAANHAVRHRCSALPLTAAARHGDMFGVRSAERVHRGRTAVQSKDTTNFAASAATMPSPT